jgi:hypothetical protein
MDVRKNTNALLEMVEEGQLSSMDVIMAALNWLSDSDVGNMAEANEFFVDEDEDDD